MAHSSGVFRIPLISMIDRELLLQRGESLRAWADQRGITVAGLADALQGNAGSPAHEDLLADLAGSLGISISAFHAWCRAETPASA